MVRNGSTQTRGSKERTAARKLDEVELLALLRPGDMGRDERVHERLEVGAPPLCQCVANHPLVIDTLSCELRANWCKALVQPGLEALDLVVFGAKVVTRASVAVSIRSIAVAWQKKKLTA